MRPFMSNGRFVSDTVIKFRDSQPQCRRLSDVNERLKLVGTKEAANDRLWGAPCKGGAF